MSETVRVIREQDLIFAPELEQARLLASEALMKAPFIPAGLPECKLGWVELADQDDGLISCTMYVRGGILATNRGSGMMDDFILYGIGGTESNRQWPLQLYYCGNELSHLLIGHA